MVEALEGMIEMTKETSKRGAPKKDPDNVRCERMGIVLTPNTLRDLRTLVAMNNDSLNNFVHELIEDEVEKNKDKMERYREFMEDM